VEDELGPSVNNHDRSPPPSSAPSIGRRGSARRLSAILSVGSTQQKWRGQVELWMARTRRAQLGMCPAAPSAGMNRTPNDQTYKAPNGGVIIAVAQPRAEKTGKTHQLDQITLYTRGRAGAHAAARAHRAQIDATGVSCQPVRALDAGLLFVFRRNTKLAAFAAEYCVVFV
jgi:hypothetical protein